MSDRTELLARVASLYYEHSLTQADVARVVGISRSTISRLLQEAKDAGIVEITVHYPWKSAAGLGRRLCERFDLRDAEVLAGSERTPGEVVEGLGFLAARFLETILVDGAVLGVSWGDAVRSAVRALDPARLPPIIVVQMVGAVGEGDPGADGPGLTRRLAELSAGRSQFLHAPLIVESDQVREALLREPRISQTLSLARRADIALVGIGSVVPDTAGTMWAGYLVPDAIARLRQQGAVGNICARHYNAEGAPVALELDRRVVGIDLKSLHEIKRVIGVAGGRVKAQAILGALRGRHINVLITDEAAAEEILLLDAGDPAGLQV